jgi:hypothetical protein
MEPAAGRPGRVVARFETLEGEYLLDIEACRKVAHKHLTPKLPVADAYTAAEKKD